jgi:DNA-binding CsgD family transcriptional regulator
LAAADRKPVAATNYRESSVITHDYDREVTAEGIVSLLAVPVVVDGRVRAVLYGGHRVTTQFGDAIVRDTLKVSRTLAWEISVADEVDRRLALLETERPELESHDPLSADRFELRELYAELRELGRAVADPDIARRLDAVGRRILPHGMTVSVPTPLSPRELDMLAQVALGKRNGQIAAQLALSETTVKSYVSTAMHKLNATSRYEAVIAARRAGLIP